jgi:hypothetical protein
VTDCHSGHGTCLAYMATAVSVSNAATYHLALSPCEYGSCDTLQLFRWQAS